MQGLGRGCWIARAGRHAESGRQDQQPAAHRLPTIAGTLPPAWHADVPINACQGTRPRRAPSTTSTSAATLALRNHSEDPLVEVRQPALGKQKDPLRGEL